MTNAQQSPNAQRKILVNRLFPKLRRFFASKTQGADEAQDLTHSTLVVFLSRDPDQLANPRRYIWGIAHNMLKKHYSRHNGHEFDTEVASLQHISTTVGTRLDRKTRLSDAMRRIPIVQQTAIDLRFGEELMLSEVAEATSRSLASVKRDIAAGLASLREILGTRDGDEQLGLQVGADYRQS